VRSASGDEPGARGGGDKVAAATSSTSLYDNVTGPKRGEPGYGSMRQRERGGGVGGNMQPPQQEVLLTAGSKPGPGNQQNHVSQQQQQQSVEVNQPPGPRQPPSGGNQSQQQQSQLNHRQRMRDVGSMKQDYSDVESSREAELRHKRAKSKSTDDMTLGERGAPGGGNISLDSNTLKRMLKPMPSMESPVTSPEMSRRRYGRHHHHHHHHHHPHPDMGSSFLSEPETSSAPINHHRPNSAAATSRFSNSRSAHEFGRGLYLELERDRGDQSPPSDNVLFDNQCYATTPSSSNGNNSDMEPSGQPHNTASTPGSPTSRLLLEYEMHLRNTLAKGMDAESYSLHTFEALLTQSMENLGESLKSQYN
jgi:T-lymphoma invasion and metastasis-inducing protein 1